MAITHSLPRHTQTVFPAWIVYKKNNPENAKQYAKSTYFGQVTVYTHGQSACLAVFLTLPVLSVRSLVQPPHQLNSKVCRQLFLKTLTGHLNAVVWSRCEVEAAGEDNREVVELRKFSHYSSEITVSFSKTGFHPKLEMTEARSKLWKCVC